MDWDKLDWADIFRRLTLFAFRRRQLRGVAGSLADAEDLAAEAIRRLIDSDFAEWDREREPDLLRHLGSIVNGLLSNEMRAARTKVENSLSDPAVSRSAEQTPAPENGSDDSDESRRVLSLLEARIAGDELAKKILVLEEQGITKAAAQAAHLKKSTAIVYKARRRLARHRKAVERELAAENSHTNGIDRAQSWVRS